MRSPPTPGPPVQIAIERLGIQRAIVPVGLSEVLSDGVDPEDTWHRLSLDESNKRHLTVMPAGRAGESAAGLLQAPETLRLVEPRQPLRTIFGRDCVREAELHVLSRRGPIHGLLEDISGGGAKLLCREKDQPVRVMGLDFPNPVGVAPGLDKNADCFEALGELGFGFVEVGTVTPRAQPGNPKPRVFRLVEAQGMINRLGFNNKGVDYLVRRVKNHRFKGVLGINIGKNFDTPIENAADDYLLCLEKVYPYADYITVNISSPNTQNLRDLQGEDALDSLLGALSGRREELADETGRRVPMALKVAPDLEEGAVPAIADVVAHHGMDAVIATNTTIDRSAVAGMKHAGEGGGHAGQGAEFHAHRGHAGVFPADHDHTFHLGDVHDDRFEAAAGCHRVLHDRIHGDFFDHAVGS